jgi:hypothetical protein
MRIVILLTFFATLANAQVYFQGDSIVIEEPAFSNSMTHQIHIQNADDLDESVYFWDLDGRGSFLSPYCNVIVSRSAMEYDSTMFQEWSVSLKKVNAIVTASALPGKLVRVNVTGGYEYDLRISHISGSKMYYQANGMGFFPTGRFSGTMTAFVPYRIPGAQVVSVRVLAGGCTHVVGKLIYLN